MVDMRPPMFDAHLHIIDARFPLVPNNGYLPEPFTVADYRARTAHLGVVGGQSCPARFRPSIKRISSTRSASSGPVSSEWPNCRPGSPMPRCWCWTQLARGVGAC